MSVASHTLMLLNVRHFWAALEPASTSHLHHVLAESTWSISAPACLTATGEWSESCLPQEVSDPFASNLRPTSTRLVGLCWTQISHVAYNGIEIPLVLMRG